MAYTLRLDENQEKQLKEVMILLNTSTATKAIIELIRRYESDQDELQRLRKEVHSLKNDWKELRYLYQESERIDERISLHLMDE
ncbi:hypothetical protein [Tunicatimonas pelagia]|uniref:hypothetical protein n=1 Tax=Tunicatimonas pelagia TaxID=931531 RepID=UPI002665C843|nr:hypothetical protein [Tunicatimonas pelagia]WKN43765.1 hypothetical protein P0M28_02110 [Tunicatimonas pelagia]